MRPRALALPALVALALGSLAGGARAQSPARLPERTFALAEARAPEHGRSIAVGVGANLQAALEAAQPGDTLLLDPRGVFGPIVLPQKSGDRWITLRSNAPLPDPGTRATPALAAQMPKLLATGGPAIVAAPGAHHYRFVGLEVRPREGEFVYALVELGDNGMTAAELPHDLLFDRCYLHGDAAVGGRRGIALNSGAAAIVDSTLSDFKETGADSQAIAGWSGPGPFAIENNYLEAAGENLLFGGADPPGPDRIPSDIVVRGNRFEKPLRWKAGAAGYAGTHWSVKNLLELKDARRVLIEGNVFERNWAQAQNGFAILFTVRNQEGGAPWSVVEDVTFARNLVSDTSAAINILGRDDSHGGRSEQTKRIAIRDNRFEHVGDGEWGGSGTLFQILEGTADISIEHNTAFQSGSVVVADGPPNRGFAFRNNLILHNAYGIIGSGSGSGSATLAAYFPAASVEGNVFIGGDAARYPRGNFFPPSLEAVFADADRQVLRTLYAGAGAAVAKAQ